jgi:hypothetical protein
MGEPSTLPSQLGPAARSARIERDALLRAHDFDAAPFAIAWEVTRACAYSCVHCRADAQPKRDPRELDTAEGKRLIDMLAGFGTHPILVLTGGDPLMRRDLFELARYADERGLRVSLTPTATALPTRERMREASAAGIRRVAFSLDAAIPAVHDRFRGFDGSFTRTLAGMRNATDEDLPSCSGRSSFSCLSVAARDWRCSPRMSTRRRSAGSLTSRAEPRSTSRRPRRRSTGGLCGSGRGKTRARARGFTSPTGWTGPDMARA